MNLIESNMDKIIALCKKYKVSKLFVFGSILTNRFNKENDVDFIVNFDKAQVTDYEAHAWTENYIEHIGWIPVEVTGRDTGESVYKHVEQEEKQRNAIVPNKKQFVTNVKKMFQMIPIVIILAVIFAFIKLLQKKRKWNQMTNKEKVLFYEKQLEKYAENGAKSRNNSNSMTSEIIEKARYSNKDITRHELNLVKRHLDLLKRKNRNVTKILTKPK